MDSETSLVPVWTGLVWPEKGSVYFKKSAIRNVHTALWFSLYILWHLHRFLSGARWCNLDILRTHHWNEQVYCPVDRSCLLRSRPPMPQSWTLWFWSQICSDKLWTKNGTVNLKPQRAVPVRLWPTWYPILLLICFQIVCIIILHLIWGERY